MKKVFLLAVFLALWAVCYPAQAYSPPTASFVSVDAPGSGETIEGGSEYAIEWETSSDIPVVAIYYTLDGDEWNVIESCTDNDKRHRWDVPMASSEDVRIKVEGLEDCQDKNVIAEDVGGRFTIDFEGADPCTCFSCRDCSEKLKSPGCVAVYLGQDISASSGQCVSFSGSHRTFDCQGNSIAGGGAGGEFYYGVFLVNANDVTVRGCEVSGFGVGVQASKSKNVRLTESKIFGNGVGVFFSETESAIVQNNDFDGNDVGVSLSATRGVNLRENVVCGSSTADIFTDPGLGAYDTLRDGTVCDLVYNWNNDGDVTWCEETCASGATTAVSSGPELQRALLGDYGRVSLTSDVTAGEGIVVNSSHVKLLCNGHRISGLGSGTGVVVRNKAGFEMKDCVVDNFNTGLLLEGASKNTISSSTFTNNKYGVVIQDTKMPSLKNTVSGNVIRPNVIYGVFLDGNVRENVFESNQIEGGEYPLYTTASCDNTIPASNRGGKEGKVIGYVTSSYVTLSDMEYSELILCDVVNAVVERVRISGSGDGGVVIKDSEDVQLRESTVTKAQNGILVLNSSNVRLQRNSIVGGEKDCVAIEGSSGVEVSGGSLMGCGRGVYAHSSNSTIVRDVGKLENNSVAGIYLSSSDQGRVSGCVIERGAAPQSARGIVLEGSDNNTFENNTVRDMSAGVSFDFSSASNKLKDNMVCGNALDISNAGSGNGGSGNACGGSIKWGDSGFSGCASCCSPPASDVDGDGVDDACDCDDAHQGPAESGVDCGGRCGPCTECKWCGENIAPVRLSGPPEGRVDVVFIPHEDFIADESVFEEDVRIFVRDYFLNISDLAEGPLPDGFIDRFNFYVYKGGFAGGGGCAMKLPGETEYVDWLSSCSSDCVITSGLGCDCFTSEPEGFFSDASWADVAAVLSRDGAGCASSLGPQSRFSSDTSGSLILHEFGHSVFGLVDEYCGSGYYMQNDPHPNVWSSLSECVNEVEERGWYLGECRRIEDGGCSADFFRYDPDAPVESFMSTPNTNGNYRFWEAASERMDYLLGRYPASGNRSSRGILILMEEKNGVMKKLGLSVVSNHPDLGMQVPVYWAEAVSAGGGKIGEFGVWDYGSPVSEDSGGAHLSDVVFPLTVPFDGNIRWVNVYNASSGSLVLSMDLGPELYGWCRAHDWDGDDCQALDVDDSGLPDSLETSSWLPHERIKNKSFGPLDLKTEDIISELEEEDEPATAQADGSRGFLDFFLSASLAVLAGAVVLFLAALVALAVFVSMNDRKKRESETGPSAASAAADPPQEAKAQTPAASKPPQAKPVQAASKVPQAVSEKKPKKEKKPAKAEKKAVKKPAAKKPAKAEKRIVEKPKKPPEPPKMKVEKIVTPRPPQNQPDAAAPSPK